MKVFITQISDFKPTFRQKYQFQKHKIALR